MGDLDGKTAIIAGAGRCIGRAMVVKLAAEGARVVVNVSSIVGRRINVGISQEYLDAAEHAIPLGRAGTVVEAAGAVYLMCTPASDYVSGQVLVCGGGFTG